MSLVQIHVTETKFFEKNDYSPAALRGRAEFLSAKSEVMRDDTLRGRAAVKVREFIIAHDSKMTEYLNAFVLMVWGLWVLFPYTNAFDNPAYDYLKIFSEASWGIAFFVIGFIQFTNLTRNASNGWRRSMLSVSFTAWFVLSVLFVMASPGTPAFLPEVMVMTTLYKFLRLSLMKE